MLNSLAEFYPSHEERDNVRGILGDKNMGKFHLNPKDLGRFFCDLEKDVKMTSSFCLWDETIGASIEGKDENGEIEDAEIALDGEAVKFEDHSGLGAIKLKGVPGAVGVPDMPVPKVPDAAAETEVDEGDDSGSSDESESYDEDYQESWILINDLVAAAAATERPDMLHIAGIFEWLSELYPKEDGRAIIKGHLAGLGESLKTLDKEGYNKLACTLGQLLYSGFECPAIGPGVTAPYESDHVFWSGEHYIENPSYFRHHLNDSSDFIHLKVRLLLHQVISVSFFLFLPVSFHLQELHLAAWLQMVNEVKAKAVADGIDGHRQWKKLLAFLDNGKVSQYDFIRKYDDFKKHILKDIKYGVPGYKKFAY